MPSVTIHPLAIVTFERLAGLRAFIDLLDDSLPEVSRVSARLTQDRR